MVRHIPTQMGIAPRQYPSQLHTLTRVIPDAMSYPVEH